MKRTMLTVCIAAAGMVVTAGAAFGQYGKGAVINAGAGSGADTQIISTTVMNLVKSKIQENFNNKIAMPQMRNKFMNDPNVVGAMEAQIIPTMQQQMMQKTKADIQGQQMGMMSNMSANLQF